MAPDTLVQAAAKDLPAKIEVSMNRCHGLALFEVEVGSAAAGVAGVAGAVVAVERSDDSNQCPSEFAAEQDLVAATPASGVDRNT